MSLRQTKGDITIAGSGIILHECSLQNTMEVGLAKTLYETWPEVKQDYHMAFIEVYPSDVPPRLGQVQFVKINSNLVVANGFTQDSSDNKKTLTTSEAIEKCINTCAGRLMMDDTPAEQKKLHLPQIGCGLGGLSWKNDVLPIIKASVKKYPQVTFVIWEI